MYDLCMCMYDPNTNSLSSPHISFFTHLLIYIYDIVKSIWLHKSDRINIIVRFLCCFFIFFFGVLCGLCVYHFYIRFMTWQRIQKLNLWYYCCFGWCCCCRWWWCECVYLFICICACVCVLAKFVQFSVCCASYTLCVRAITDEPQLYTIFQDG